MAWLAGAIGLLAVTIASWRYVYFFRDPDRVTPDGRNIIAPADGRIVYVRRFENGTVPIAIKKAQEIPLHEITKGPVPFRSGYIIGTYMTLWDTHVNRAPISGSVERIDYHPATRNSSMAMFGFQMILLGRARPQTMTHILQNERNTICIRGEFPVYVIQIADLYVNTVVCWTRRGQQIRKGERIGKIVMGSQVDLVVPDVEGLTLLINEGDYVRAGATIVATY